MKRIPYVIAAASLAMSASALAANVGVSINVGEPGFFGQIDIGNAPPPVLLAPQPVIVQAPVGVAPPPPIYLHVPPGHARNWRRYCAEYNACGRPVYFVKDDWYNNVYAPRYRHDHPERFEHWDRDHRAGRRDERADRDDRHDRGRGHDRD